MAQTMRDVEKFSQLIEALASRPLLPADSGEARQCERIRLRCRARLRGPRIASHAHVVDASAVGFRVVGGMGLEIGDRVRVDLLAAGTGALVRFECVVVWLDDTEAGLRIESAPERFSADPQAIARAAA